MVKIAPIENPRECLSPHKPDETSDCTKPTSLIDSSTIAPIENPTKCRNPIKQTSAHKPIAFSLRSPEDILFEPDSLTDDVTLVSWATLFLFLIFEINHF